MGMHTLYKFNTVQAGNGVGNEFLYIIAAVVGGTLLTGGYGNAIGAAIGSFIFGMTSLCIVYAGWDPNWFRAFLGVMLLLAVLVNLYVKKLSTTQEGGLAMTDTISEHADQTLTQGEALVEMDDVGKRYGAIRALKGINLTVRAGEVTCVLGDNGAGKSTLIKIISGLHPHNEGTLKVDGKEVQFGSPARGAGPRHRHGLPGPRRRRADGGVAQLLPRLRADRQRHPALRPEGQGDEAHRRRGAAQDGHRGQEHRPAHRRALRRPAPVRRHRPRGVLRGAGADPRRAHGGPGRQAVRVSC